MDFIAQLSASLADRYAIEHEIGRGGMATVYLARDVRQSRRVALKVLNPELGAVLGVERFLSEIRVTANLQHPNLLPLFDSGEVEGLLFYVMPFVEGESLRQRVDREKQLPIDEAVRISAAIASALDYAHRRGVIHRDLKPESVLMHEGQPLVADFGIALAVSNAGGQRVTQTGLSLGTPQYMSPEQATGDRSVAMLVERRAGGTRKLPGGRARDGSPPRDTMDLFAPPQSEETAPEQEEPSAASAPDAADASPTANELPRESPPPRDVEVGTPEKRGPRRPTRLGLNIQFESRPDDAELGRLVERTIWVNDAHPAYRRAAASRSEGYHIALAVAMALAKVAVDAAQEHEFVLEFLARWGEARDGARRRRKRRG